MSESKIEETKVEDVVMEKKEEGEKPLSKRQLRRARTICSYWLLGKCTKGDQCPFKHVKDETVDVPVCKYFMKNACKNAENCPFSHDLKRVKCVEFKCGTCEKGDECPFSHDFEPISVKIEKRAAEEAAEKAERKAKKAKLDAAAKKKREMRRAHRLAKAAKKAEVVEIPTLDKEEQAKYDN